MGQLDIKKIIKRSAAAWEIKDRWRPLLEEAWELVMPGINPYVLDKKQPRMNNRQFDSTAPNAVFKLANRILNEMTPPHEAWIDLKVGSVLEMKFKNDQGKLKEMNEQLAGVSSILNTLVNSGEMVAARHMAILDMLISGMGPELALEDPDDDVNPVISTSVPSSEVAVEKDARGQNVGIFRRHTIKIRNIEEHWADAEVPKELKDRLRKTNEDPEVTLLECTYFSPGKGKRSKENPWYYEVIWNEEGSDATRLVERTYAENPWTIFQWLNLPGCPYGPGPVLLAMADIRTANKIVEMILKNAALALAGMYTVVDDGVLNPDNVVIQSGGLISVGDKDSMTPLETGRDFDIAQLALEKYQGAIKQWLFDNGLGPVTGKSFSATEIIQRVRELAQDIGGGVGRLTADLVPYVRRKLGILVARGVIPFDIKIDQFTVKVQINSPLARAQLLKEVETIVNWFQTVMSIGGLKLLVQVAEVEKGCVLIGERMGVPPALIKSALQIKNTQDDMAEAEAAGVGEPLPAEG